MRVFSFHPSAKRKLFAADIASSDLLRSIRSPSRLQLVTAIFVAVLCVALSLPTSFVIEGAGPALNVNGKTNGMKLVTISGKTAYESESQLYLTTVTSWGGPEAGVSGWQALGALFDSRYQLIPVRALYAEQTTQADVESEAEQDMLNSQDSAVAVANSLAGFEVREQLTVQSAEPEYPAGAVLQQGDIVLGVGRASDEQVLPVHNFIELAEFLETVEPGSEISMEIERDGETRVVEFATVAPNADETGWAKPGAMIGVAISVADVRPSARVRYAVKDIGGPSAGLMFTLGIYDALTEGSLAQNAKIAGTGTISWNGDVGEIGGIEHKMRGAARAGVTDFLAPAANCAETIGLEPQGMRVWAVRNAREAVTAASAIGKGDTSSLTSCQELMRGLGAKEES